MGIWRRVTVVGMMVVATAPALASATPAVQASVPSQVFLGFNNPAPSDPTDPCRTSTVFKINQIGDHDDITVCTFDSSGAPAATETSSYRLAWSITGVTTEDPAAVRFNPSPPPEHTAGTSATALAGIDAVQGGRNFVTVTLLDETGAAVDSFSLEKQVEGGGCNYVFRGPTTLCRDVPTKLIARAKRALVRGRAESEPECEPDRHVTLFLRRRGKDNLIGTDITNSLGRWRVRAGRLDGIYYARVAYSDATDNETGGTIDCLPDQSDDVRG